jgi:hypothetical protein
MRSRIACNAALAAMAVLAAAAPARAEPTAEERTQAEALFRDAKKLMQRGKIPEACEKLAASYKIDPVGGTLLNLAMCHEVEGKTATAWTEFNEALSLAKKQGRKDRQKAASEHIAALEARLSRVTITIPPSSNAAGIALKIDGVAVEAAAIGTPIPLDPGDHVVSAIAPEKKPWETKITLREGQRQELVVPALESNAPAPPPPPERAIRWQKPVGFAALGVGAVLLGVGTFFGVRAMSLGTTVSTECPENACSPSGWKALGDGRTAANVSNGTLIAGGALAAAGTALVIVGFVAAPADAPKGARIPLEIAPAIAPDGAFLAARGAF